MLKRKTILLAFGITVLAAGCWLLYRTVQHAPRTSPLSTVGEFTGANVSVMTPTGWKVETLPKEKIPSFLKLLSDAQPDPKPARWVSLYRVDLETTGPKIEVAVFLTGSGPGAFSVNGKYFRGATDKAFQDAIKSVRH